MQTIQTTTINVSGINIYYRDTVSSTPTILCLHGKWGSGETWTDFITRYRERYRIIVPDQRGHGLSDKPVARYASEDFAADISGLIKHLELDPVILIGHSMGGRNAACLAINYPQVVKALVILDSSTAGPQTISSLPPEQVPAYDELTAEWPMPYQSYAAAVNDLSSRLSLESNVSYFAESLVETENGFDFRFSRYAMAAINEYRQGLHHLLPKIQCPVLLVRATDSWSLSKEEAGRMQALIKDCTYFEVTNSDHMVYADNPYEFYPRLDDFLKRIA